MSRVPRVKRDYQVDLCGRKSPSVYLFSTCEYGEWHGLLVSQSHFRRRNGSWSGGGPFYQYSFRRQVDSGFDFAFRVRDVDYVYHLRGTNGLAQWREPSPATYANASSGLADQYSATGYKRTRPGKPEAGVAQFIGELRDLPRLPGGAGLKELFTPSNWHPSKIREIPRILWERLKDYRALGSEYLNVQFGWVPFVNDLRKMYHLWKHLDKRLRQLAAENGKVIRRRATLKSDSSVSSSSSVSPYAFFSVYGQVPDYFSGDPGTKTTLTTTTTTRERVWYTGAYRYWIPDVGSSKWTARATAALFGVTPTPAVVWELMPWSWLVDWFSNTGDVIDNLMGASAVDNLVQLHGYVMQEKTTSTTSHAQCSVQQYQYRSADGHLSWDWSNVDRSFWIREIETTKIRVEAGSPYGLSANWDGLSPYQLSILAALGLTRV